MDTHYIDHVCSRKNCYNPCGYRGDHEVCRCQRHINENTKKRKTLPGQKKNIKAFDEFLQEHSPKKSSQETDEIIEDMVNYAHDAGWDIQIGTDEWIRVKEQRIAIRVGDNTTLLSVDQALIIGQSLIELVVEMAKRERK
jgi:hypothetical protein